MSSFNLYQERIFILSFPPYVGIANVLIQYYNYYYYLFYV